MKKKIFLGLFVLMLITCMTVVQANAVSINLNVLDDSIIIGEAFGVEVWVDGEGIGEELLAFGFDVDTGGSSFFSYTGYIIESGFDDISFGPNNVAGATLPGNLNDDILLATLLFTADAVGTDIVQDT